MMRDLFIVINTGQHESKIPRGAKVQFHQL